MSAPAVVGLGQCHCGKLANAKFRCNCGWTFAYCGACFQTGVRAAATHAETCESMRKALGEPPRQLSIPAVARCRP